MYLVPESSFQKTDFISSSKHINHELCAGAEDTKMWSPFVSSSLSKARRQKNECLNGEFCPWFSESGKPKKWVVISVWGWDNKRLSRRPALWCAIKCASKKWDPEIIPAGEAAWARTDTPHARHLSAIVARESLWPGKMAERLPAVGLWALDQLRETTQREVAWNYKCLTSCSESASFCQFPHHHHHHPLTLMPPVSKEF